MIGRPWLAAVGCVGVLLAGCGSPEADPAASSTSASSSAASSTSAAPFSSAAPQQPSPKKPDLQVTIAGGQVTPTNAELDATVGTPITLEVTSDTGDELHVHAIPEHTFTIQPAAGQRFEFTVDVPGRVEVELHGLHRTVATIQVRP